MLSPFRTGPPRLLQGHPVFTSRDIDDAREQVARLFCAHGLQQVGAAQALDCHMHRVPLGALSLNYLGYGADVEITPGCLGSFYLVQIPLAGQAEIRCGRQRAESDTRTAVVLSPDQPVAMRWHADCAQLMLHIPRALVEQRVSSAPDRPGARLDFALALPQSTGPAAGWCRMVLDLAHNIDAHGAAWLQHEAAVASLQDMLLAGLLSLQPHDQSAAAPSPEALPRHVQRATEFIRAQAEQALGVTDIARAACVSVRALEEGFRRHLGTTPGAYLRTVRLQQVHAQLRAAAREGRAVPLYEMAYRYGFFHLGRFSAYYKAQFGEPPSATLKRR